MRKISASLFISVDGVVEAPNQWIRPELYGEFPHDLNDGQDAVLMGRVTYEEWAPFWPTSDIEPFASFINGTPKFVVSKSLKSAEWSGTTILSGDFKDEITKLKDRPGKTIGVGGSIHLVHSLLEAGLLDELTLTLCPAIAGHGRRLFSRDGDPIQLDLRSSRTTPGGLQILTYAPHLT